MGIKLIIPDVKINKSFNNLLHWKEKFKGIRLTASCQAYFYQKTALLASPPEALYCAATVKLNCK
jgi:hypothetical protein